MRWLIIAGLFAVIHLILSIGFSPFLSMDNEWIVATILATIASVFVLKLNYVSAIKFGVMTYGLIFLVCNFLLPNLTISPYAYLIAPILATGIASFIVERVWR